MRTLPRNMKVEFLGIEGEWSLIKDENGEGYVKSAFLREGTVEDDIRYGIVEPSRGDEAIVTAERSLFIRKRPSSLSEITGVLYHGETVIILDYVGKWVEVISGTYRGFVSKFYLR